MITCSKYNAHSEPLFKELILLTLEDIRKLQKTRTKMLLQVSAQTTTKLF